MLCRFLYRLGAPAGTPRERKEGRNVMRFAKMHGLGNDYVFVDSFTQPPVEAPDRLSIALSRPHTGVGSDGLILIEPCEGADARMRIFNADGSEAQICGNGLRCVCKYLYDFGLCRKETLRILTGAGLREATLTVENDRVRLVTVDMGAPEVLQRERRVCVDGEDVPFCCVSMGNPHAVTFARFVTGEELARQGAQVEHDAQFPERTNVEFCRVDEAGIHVSVWERGSGATMACGSGACASLAAAVVLGKSPRKNRVLLPGGALEIEWRASDGHIYMTGPAQTVFVGELAQ